MGFPMGWNFITRGIVRITVSPTGMDGLLSTHLQSKSNDQNQDIFQLSKSSTVDMLGITGLKNLKMELLEFCGSARLVSICLRDLRDLLLADLDSPPPLFLSFKTSAGLAVRVC